MANAVKCDKCGEYFDQRPPGQIELADGLILCVHILKSMTKEELEANPTNVFMTLIGARSTYKPQDLCPKCHQDVVVAALNNLVMRSQIEEIGNGKENQNAEK